MNSSILGTDVDEKALSLALNEAVPNELRFLCHTLSEHKKRSWIVGGSVRDLLSALEQQDDEKSEPVPHHHGDWDLATDALPEEMMLYFRSVIPTGIEHGTVTVVLNGRHFEVTTLRGEVGHSDGRHPDRVYFVTDLHEDLLRRDFTVNAMAFNLADNSFHDPFHGADDHKNRILRAVGNPAERFFEDGLRVLRCARFCATLGFDIEEETRKAIFPSLHSFKQVARERVRDEWQKALESEKPSRFLEVIRTEKILPLTLPDLYVSASDSEYECAILRVNEAPRDFIPRLALFVLLGTRTGLPAEARRKVGEEVSRIFRLSRSQSARIVCLLEFARPRSDLVDRPDGASIRHYLSRIGRTHCIDVLNLLPLSCPLDAPQGPSRLLSDRAIKELTSGAPLSLSELKIGGKDLIDAGIVTPGRAVGVILGRLLETVLTSPEKNEPTVLLDLARTLAD